MTAAILPLLSTRQRRLLAFVRDFHTATGCSPALMQVAAAVALDEAGLRAELCRLRAAGWIRPCPDRPRAFQFLNPADGTAS